MRGWSILLVLSFALAGCSDSGGEPDDDEVPIDDDPSLPQVNDTVPPPPPPGPVRFDGCVAQVVRMPVDEATARAALPSGFDPVPFNGVPGAYNQVLVVAGCEAARNDTVEFQNSNVFLIYYDVDPPSEYQDEERAGYRFLTYLGADGEDLQLGLAATGITGEEITITGDAPTTGPHVSAVYDIRTSIGDLINRVEGETTGPYAEFTLRFFTADEDGEVQGGFDFIAGAGANVHTGSGSVLTMTQWDFSPNAAGLGFVYMPSSDDENLRLEAFTLDLDE